MNIEQGSLREISAGSLLLKIFELQKTGVLYLKRDEILKELYIERGKLVWTASNSEVDTLENMLILQKKLSKENVEEEKKQAKNEIELGKILVEKRTITLEELIEYSKVQMRKILKSVLKWSDGVYYFSKDVPANTFVNLEIDLKDFVYNFVKYDLDMGVVWKGIGSFQEIFYKTGDDPKIEKYNLSKEELELLDKFTGEVNVEVISLNYVGLPKEEILKIIYFFLMSDLLVKDEESNEKLLIPDSILEQGNVQGTDNKENIVSLGQIDLDEVDRVDVQIDEMPESKETGSGIGKPPVINIGESTGPASPDISITDKMLLDLKNEKTGKKSRLFNYFLYFIVTALIASGAIFLYLNNRNDNSNNNIGFKIKTKNQKSTNSPDKKIMNNSIVKKSDNKNLIKKNIPLKTKNVNMKNKGTDKNKKKKISNKSKNTINKSVNLKRSRPPSYYLARGQYKKAADIWKDQLKGSQYTHSILLELDCLKESVKYAYRKIVNKSRFFLLARNRNGRICYLVLFGRFKSESNANNTINTLPSYFLKQNNPPRVLELKKYL